MGLNETNIYVFKNREESTDELCKVTGDKNCCVIYKPLILDGSKCHVSCVIIKRDSENTCVCVYLTRKTVSDKPNKMVLNHLTQIYLT